MTKNDSVKFGELIKVPPFQK